MTAPDAAHVLSTAVLTPLGSTTDELWQALCQCRTSVQPSDDLAGLGLYTHHASLLSTPQLEEMAHPQGVAVGLALKVAHLALAQAPRPRTKKHQPARGLVLASTKGELGPLQQRYHIPLARPALTPPTARPDWDPLLGLQATLAKTLSIDGPQATVSLACASGNAALALASSWIARGACQHALVVGVDLVWEFLYAGFAALRALSQTHCRPFAHDRDGLTLGEGAAAMVLSASAEGDDNKDIVIGGHSLSTDAYDAVSPEPQGAVLRQAMADLMLRAGFSDGPSVISAHGTGTVQNDHAEAQAFAALWPQAPVTGLKGHLGHTLGAAALLDAVAAVEMLRRQEIHPLVTQGEAIHPTLVTSARRAPLRTVLSPASGFGGLNAVVLFACPS